MTFLGQIAEILEAAARRARELDADERAERRDWTAQEVSPLGRRRHVASVRRRVAAGEAGAAIVGRRHLLSAEALTDELGRVSSGERRPGDSGVGGRLRARLGLVAGGGK